jgi:hypothetical protein
MASITALLLGCCWKDGVLQVRPNRAQHGRPEQNAGEQLAHNRGLADSPHRFAKEASDDNKHDELDEKDDLRCTFCAFCGECAAGAECK